MNFKKFISGVSALTIAASAFAGMAVTASASDLSGSLVTTASQVAGNTKRQWNYSKGQTEIQTGNNEAGQPWAGYAYLRMSLPEIPDGEQVDSAEFTVNIQFGSNSGARNAVLAVADGLVINNDVEDGVYSYGGEWETAPVNSWDGGGVTISAPVADTTYDKGKAPTSYAAWTNDVSDAVKAAYAANETEITFAVYGKRSVSSAYPKVTTDGIALSVTTKTMGAAEAINVSYTLDNTEIKSEAIDISDENKVEGNEYSFATPAYIEYEGAVYATDMTRKTATLAAGTTNVEIPVTLAAADGYFFEAEGKGGADESTNAGAYSNGKGARRLDNKQVAITVPEAGVYKVTVALVCKSSDNSKNATISAYSNAYDAEATPLWSITDTYYNAYRASKFTQEDVEIEEDGKLVFYTSDWNMGIDYILLEKTGELPTPEDETVSKAFVFENVTLNDFADKTLYVTIGDKSGSKAMSELITTALAGEGDINVGLIITGIPVAYKDAAVTAFIN